MSKLKLFLFLCVFIITLYGVIGCTKKQDKIELKPQKIGDYLYYLELDDYTYEAIPSDDSGLFGFGCSSIRKGNLYGRNLDLGYCETPEFIIKLSSTENRFASISICTNPTITPDVDQMSEDELLLMPSITNDGINENGVIVSVNVVDVTGVDDMKQTVKGKTQIHASRIVRYLLDHAESAKHAISLMNDLDIVGGFAGLGLHWMIADENDTYIVEIINNELKISKNEYYYMTNFYLNLGPLKEEQYVADTLFEKIPLLNDYAIGVERWCILRDNYDSISDDETMLDILEMVRGTAMYDQSNNPRWYSECCGGDLSIYSDKESFDKELDRQIEYFETRDRKDPKGDWISWHTSIYDFSDKSLKVYSQEDYFVCYRLSFGDSLKIIK